MKKDLISALVIGVANTPDKAKKIASTYRKCPQVHYIAAQGSQVYMVFYIPIQQRWWMDYVNEEPGLAFGLESASVTVLHETNYLTKYTPRIPTKKTEVAPCGSICRNCPQIDKCLGCPATIFYKE
ncbi:MAG: hypothetical protein ACW976_05550 [Candidatus Ranarchaeia archaeon]|jgi:hypothetical protein